MLVATYRTTEQSPGLRAATTELRRRSGTRTIDLRRWVPPRWRPTRPAGRTRRGCRCCCASAGETPWWSASCCAPLAAAGLARAGPAGRRMATGCTRPPHRPDRGPAGPPRPGRAAGSRGHRGHRQRLHARAPAAPRRGHALRPGGRRRRAGRVRDRGRRRAARRPAPRCAHDPAHALVRDAVYALLPAARRLDWHARLAVAIEAGRLPGEPVTHRLRSSTDAAGRAAAVRACRPGRRGGRRHVRVRPGGQLLDAALALPGSDLGRPARSCGWRRRRPSTGPGGTDAAIRRCREVAARAPTRSSWSAPPSSCAGTAVPHNPDLIRLCDTALRVLSPQDDAGGARGCWRSGRWRCRKRWAGRGSGRPAPRPCISPSAAARPGAGRRPPRPPARGQRPGGGDRTARPGRADDRARRQRRACRRRAVGQAVAGGRGVRARRDWTWWTPSSTGSTGLVERLGWPIAAWHRHRSLAARHLFAGRFDEAEAEADRAWPRRGDRGRTAIGIDAPSAPSSSACAGVTPTSWRCCVAVRRWPAGLQIFWAQAGSFLLEAGETDRAHRYLRDAAPGPRDAARGRPVAGHGPADRGVRRAARRHGDRPRLAGAGHPYADHYIAGGSGTVRCDGAVSRVLGVVAAALGREDEAERWLTDAVAMEDRIGALPYRVFSEIALARAAGRPTGRDRTRRRPGPAGGGHGPADRDGPRAGVRAGAARRVSAPTSGRPWRSPPASARCSPGSRAAARTGRSPTSSCCPSARSRPTWRTCSASSGPEPGRGRGVGRPAREHGAVVAAL